MLGLHSDRLVLVVSVVRVLYDWFFCQGFECKVRRRRKVHYYHYYYYGAGVEHVYECHKTTLVCIKIAFLSQFS